MGLCTVQPIIISKTPNASPLLLPNPKPSFPFRKVPTISTAALLSRSICLRNVLSKATASEESSSGASQVFDEKRDGIIVLDEVEAVDKKGFNEIDPKQELPVEEQEGLSLNVLDNLNTKFDADDAGAVVLYAGGAVLALWLTSAVIGAIDSIPLFPKVLEVVGLGYTVWFTSRYLIFKKNRDELIVKIEELKEQVLGSED
ncbi:hypothetical protein TanjilG_15978 [Lupinus angustifolius]|uniref:Cyanobacterial aminoacyl-tRNA synthetase CAAD domain-containing protein n=1 Tax=Lupinus angustifolius TaxID=3871 RepID=A0A4P1RGS1_LUPAN|nr:PREDICTED: protein CURVATURE THYLAKOID 1D, chloroplastic-like [Lupinus angustifolius]XP_019445407.1 PREDICTED: protein CURVATURE THYLAKOID 1D, chloroplastic-like [Lupinus angustifolius]OIW10606.1 hypothetical protein TanjilG_15978 [Lupinus angustifolius]